MILSPLSCVYMKIDGYRQQRPLLQWLGDDALQHNGWCPTANAQCTESYGPGATWPYQCCCWAHAPRRRLIDTTKVYTGSICLGRSTIIVKISRYLYYSQDTYAIVKIPMLWSRYLCYSQDTCTVVKEPIL